jgi:protocatechuate 3,4-dioxygenase, alpha subunit
MALCACTSQTVGPFFAVGLRFLETTEMAGLDVAGERITIRGRVLDGDREPIPDAMIEIWQANSHGKYAHEADEQEKPLEPGFRGFGRCGTSAEGTFCFHTTKPGRVPGPNGLLQAPHVEVAVFMRGLMKQLMTRVYFADEPANEEDFVLSLVEPDRRRTLMAQRLSEGTPTYTWDVVLQGEDETVFFDL